MLRREIIERRNAGLKLCRLEGRPGSCPGLPDTVHLSELIADPFMQTRMLALVGAVYTHRPAQQSSLAKAQLTNLNSPNRSHGVKVRVRVAPTMAPSGISEIMRTVLLSRNSIVATPAPTVEIKSLDDLVDLDSASIATLSRDEATGGALHRGLYDFSEVAGDSRAANKGGGSRKPKAIVCGQRVMVQSQAVSCNVVKAFVQRGGR